MHGTGDVSGRMLLYYCVNGILEIVRYLYVQDDLAHVCQNQTEQNIRIDIFRDI